MNIERIFSSIWEGLQGKKPHFDSFLAEIRLQGIRGIKDILVQFEYPVTVIAGGNASGKTTVLLAAACAYKVPGAGIRDFVPSTFFPDYCPRTGDWKDYSGEITIDFAYATREGIRPMRYRRSKGWNRSFLGRKGMKQPEKSVYLRTLGNLRNPSEVRSVLNMSRLTTLPEESHLTASEIALAQHILPFRYSSVVELSNASGGGRQNLLFATLEEGAAYSELHMAAGERAILRLAKEIAHLHKALVLIDEIEAGLHPRVQELLMLHLQQLALRNELQIIVTSHSPVVLDAVPQRGRVFLDRDEAGQVRVLPPYRDIVQDVLYGRSGDGLNLLCEDDAAEGILQGIFDILVPKLGIRRGAHRIGRDIGADEFPAHATAFRKFGRIRNLVFVLDGDQRDRGIAERIAGNARPDQVPVLFLPGKSCPEEWVWNQIRSNTDDLAGELGIGPDQLSEQMNRLDAMYAAAGDGPSEIAKAKLNGLAELLSRDSPEICRMVARRETGSNASDIQPLVEGLRDAIQRWRDE